MFDNADGLQALKVAWPSSSRGSILLTTRDFDVANNPAAQCLHVEPFDDIEGSTMLLKQIGLDPAVPANKEHATAITQVLGGLPLALGQIGGFIAQRRLPLKGFLALYEKNAAKIDARKTGKVDYEHTLSTVWDVSFQKLPENATKLLNMLIFFDPDGVDEAIFLERSQTEPGIDHEFEFVADDMEQVPTSYPLMFQSPAQTLTYLYSLGDAEQPLLQAALINKTMEQPVVTVHRLIQSAALRRLPAPDRPRYFDVVIQLLSWGFPDTWSKDVGHQINAWKKCEKCLPHIDHIAKLPT